MLHYTLIVRLYDRVDFNLARVTALKIYASEECVHKNTLLRIPMRSCELIIKTYFQTERNYYYILSVVLCRGNNTSCHSRGFANPLLMRIHTILI